MGLIIMKKDYISPEVNITYVEAYNMIAASVTEVGGNSGIDLADPNEDIPTTADAKQNVNSVQWENWEDQEEQQQ